METVSVCWFYYWGWPHEMGQIFQFLEQICAIACGTRAYMLRWFLRMSQKGKWRPNTPKSPKCYMHLAHNSPELNTFMSVGILRQYFRRKLLQFEWSKKVLNLVMSCFICHWPSYVPLFLYESSLSLHSVLLHSKFHICWRITAFPEHSRKTLVGYIWI